MSAEEDTEWVWPLCKWFAVEAKAAKKPRGQGWQFAYILPREAYCLALYNVMTPNTHSQEARGRLLIIALCNFCVTGSRPYNNL